MLSYNHPWNFLKKKLISWYIVALLVNHSQRQITPNNDISNFVFRKIHFPKELGIHQDDMRELGERKVVEGRKENSWGGQTVPSISSQVGF